MDKQAVADALDSTIADVALKERIRLGKDVNAIQKAFSELDKLQTEAMPEYNEWVALFYLHWYQLKQINLAYSMIKNLISQQPQKNMVLNDSGNLHVVDFGCGALAMQFGVALAAADALEGGHHMSSVHFDSMDQSQAMINLGETVWSEFKKRVGNNNRLKNLSLSLEAITSSTCTDNKPVIERKTGDDCWLTAIHAVYASNLGAVQDTLGYYKKQLNPDIGFITSHYFKRTLVLAASPFKSDNRYIPLNANITPQFSGQLPRITGHRRGPLYSGLMGKAKNYLDQPVHWEWLRVSVLSYARR